MSDAPSNGSPGSDDPGGLGPLESFVADPIAVLSEVVVELAPHLDLETAQKIVHAVIKEQEQLEQILSQELSEARIRSHPLWGLELFGPDGGSGHIIAPKPGAVRDPQDAITLVAVAALTWWTPARAVLRGFGFRYKFHDYVMDPGKKDLIIKP